MFILEQATNAPKGELRNSPTLSLTSVLDRGGPSTSRSGLFTPRKEIRYPLYRRLGPRAGLNGCGKCRPHRDLMPGPSAINHAVNSYLAKLILANIVTL
jgi:hypothetical protein